MLCPTADFTARNWCCKGAEEATGITPQAKWHLTTAQIQASDFDGLKGLQHDSLGQSAAANAAERRPTSTPPTKQPQIAEDVGLYEDATGPVH